MPSLQTWKTKVGALTGEFRHPSVCCILQGEEEGVRYWRRTDGEAPLFIVPEGEALLSPVPEGEPPLSPVPEGEATHLHYQKGNSRANFSSRTSGGSRVRMSRGTSI
ncbi:UNVERIFIED_CONTAM: hypothetical protein FKN15_034495 [Acipenser sinensis]